MARVVFGTTNVTSSGTAVQFNSDTAGRVHVAAFHGRAGNAGPVYLGSDSGVSATSGWELGTNEELIINYTDYAGAPLIAPEHHWMNATSTSDKVDFYLVLEN